MKVKGEGNLADALTKPLEGPGLRRHLELSGQEIMQGRHSLTPEFEAAAKEDKEGEEGESGVAGELEGAECFHTPWGYSSIGLCYQEVVPLLSVSQVSLVSSTDATEDTGLGRCTG